MRDDVMTTSSDDVTSSTDCNACASQLIMSLEAPETTSGDVTPPAGDDASKVRGAGAGKADGGSDNEESGSEDVQEGGDAEADADDGERRTVSTDTLKRSIEEFGEIVKSLRLTPGDVFWYADNARIVCMRRRDIQRMQVRFFVVRYLRLQ